MSDSDSGVHAFDQTNDMIPATGGERDGALSGTTTAEIEDPTGSRVAATSRGADDAEDAEDAEDERGDGTANGTDGAAAAPAAGSSEPTARDDGSAERSASDAGRGDAAGLQEDAAPPATATSAHDDGAGEDYAPTADLPLPGAAADAADRGDEHTYSVDSGGTATDEGVSTDAYSGAPEVAAWSAGDDGRDEGTTRTDSSTSATDDASHTGRLADAYETGPAQEVGGAARPDDASSERDATAATGDGDAAGRSGSPASLLPGDDEPGEPGHVFDQTNGVIEGLEGDSDGTADGDTRSAGER